MGKIKTGRQSIRSVTERQVIAHANGLGKIVVVRVVDNAIFDRPAALRASNNYLLAGVFTKTTRAQMGKDEGVQPSFKIDWTKKGSATYTVNGSYEDVFKFFEKRNANKEEWGKFSPTKPEVAFKPKDGPIQEVVLKIGYTITMPKWTGYKDATKPRQEAWDKMFSSLEKHEEGHRLILLEEAAIFGEKVTSQKNLDTKKLAELLKDFSPSVTKAQKKFDDATHHGAQKGVFLPAPDQCK